jgi:TRAP-type C4-dicarboxylate transport system substrate-binding protein
MRKTLLSAGVLVAGIAAAASSAAAQITLNASGWVPPSHPLVADTMMAFCRDVEKDTAGRVKCNLLPKAVVAPPQTFDAVRDGLADISFTVHGYTPGRFPLSEVAEFPFLGDTAEAVSVAYQRLYDRELKKYDEHKGVHTLAVFTHGPGQIYNTKRPITSVKDLEGMKIRVGGGVVNDVAKALGTVPMLKPAPESYELLSQGVADGLFFPKESPLSFKLIPLLKHVTFVPGGLYNVSFVMMMNPAKLAQIKGEDRAVIDKYSGEHLARRAGKAWDAMDAKSVAAMAEAKIPTLTASAAFISEIKSKTSGLEKAWADKVKAKGADGAALLTALRKEIAAYKP